MSVKGRTRHSVQRNTAAAKRWGFETHCFLAHRTESSRSSSQAHFSWVDKLPIVLYWDLLEKTSGAVSPLVRDTIVSSHFCHVSCFPPLVVSTVLCCSGVQLRPLPPGSCPWLIRRCYWVKLLCSWGMLSEPCSFWASRLGSLSSAGYCWCLSDQGKKLGNRVLPMPQQGTWGQFHSSHAAVSK